LELFRGRFEYDDALTGKFISGMLRKEMTVTVAVKYKGEGSKRRER